jgi:alpha-tubulin suppressor-like RCC1 family protein
MSVSPTHMAFATATGSLLVCGDNSHGAVDPSQKSILSIPRPMHMELLAMNRILMVSCGSNHTAVIVETENRSVLTWGDNSYGQLGYRTGAGSGYQNSRSILPRAMHLGEQAAQVACGNGFTLVLTTRMAVYMWSRRNRRIRRPSGRCRADAAN